MELELKSRGESGFSLIEGLIASLLLLFIALGLVPLIANSMISTTAGRDYSVASQHGRSRMDQLYQLPQASEEMTLDAGTVERTMNEYWKLDSHTWTGSETPTTGRWSRTTTVRIFNVQDLQDGRLDTPEDGSAPPPQAQLREIIVEVETTREGGALGAGREITLTTLKGY